MAERRKRAPRRAGNLTADQVVADAVKRLRGKRISQKELADRLGWTQSTIARLESGKRAISVADLLALAWALDVAPSYLLAGSFQEDDVPVHKTLKVPPRHMLAWVRGREPLPGANYRAFFENIPDDEWIERYGAVDEQRAAAAELWERAEALLAAGAVETAPGREAALSPERRAKLAEERAERTKQLEASQRAGKKREDG